MYLYPEKRGKDTFAKTTLLPNRPFVSSQFSKKKQIQPGPCRGLHHTLQVIRRCHKIAMEKGQGLTC